MQITIDTSVDSPELIRNACGLLLAQIGDIKLRGAEEEAADVEAARTAELLRMRPIPPPPSSDAPPPPPPPPTGPGASSAPTAVGAPPAAPGPTAGVATSLSERDSAGLPWDARIHQSSRNKKKDGTWKIKKNCDPTLVANVVKELTAAKMAATAPTAAAPAASASVEVEIPPPPAQQVSLPLAGATGGVPVPPSTSGTAFASLSVAGDAPSVPAAPVAAPGAVPQAGVGPGFRDIVNKFTRATTEGRIRPEEVATICGQAGVPNLMSLARMPEQIATVNALLDARLLQS